VQRTIDASGASFDEHNLVGLAQAFGRGVERIALAGADAAARNLADVPESERDARLAAWLDAIRGPSTDAFSILFARRLEHLARRRLAAPPSDDDISSTLDVAFVDLCGSTAFMLRSPPAVIQALADDLYAVGQEIASRHDVAAGKFLGDGVMFLSADPERVLAAACEATVLLAQRTPLGAGGGIARGRVVRRGGDWFGTPVNLASRLAECAEAGEVLVDDEAQCDALTASEWRTVVPRGLSDGRRAAVVRPG
jgi:adenylate cyclase